MITHTKIRFIVLIFIAIQQNRLLASTDHKNDKDEAQRTLIARLAWAQTEYNEKKDNCALAEFGPRMVERLKPYLDGKRPKQRKQGKEKRPAHNETKREIPLLALHKSRIVRAGKDPMPAPVDIDADSDTLPWAMAKIEHNTKDLQLSPKENVAKELSAKGGPTPHKKSGSKKKRPAVHAKEFEAAMSCLPVPAKSSSGSDCDAYCPQEDELTINDLKKKIACLENNVKKQRERTKKYKRSRRNYSATAYELSYTLAILKQHAARDQDTIARQDNEIARQDVKYQKFIEQFCELTARNNELRRENQQLKEQLRAGMPPSVSPFRESTDQFGRFTVHKNQELQSSVTRPPVKPVVVVRLLKPPSK